MKRFFALFVALSVFVPCVALAENPEPTPEVFVIEIVTTPTPEPPEKELHYNEHDLSQEVIDQQASIFWADCNTDVEKMCYAAIAVNRLVYGYPFADNLEDILSSKTEWNHGHISDRNRDKAERFLNKALTQYVDGEYAGLSVPSTAVYVRRESGKLVFLNYCYEEVYRLD